MLKQNSPHRGDSSFSMFSNQPGHWVGNQELLPLTAERQELLLALRFYDKATRYLKNLPQLGKFFVEIWGSTSKILFITKRWKHHAQRSGYYPIVDSLGPRFPSDPKLIPIPAGMIKWLARHIGMTEPHAFHECFLLRMALIVGKFNFIHILDGDFDRWPYAPRPRWLKAHLICTFHQPPDVLKKIVSTIPRGAIDGAIAVARCQMPVLESIVNRDDIWYLPHGVDCTYFKPLSNLKRNEFLIVCCGTHRRDFKTLLAAAELIRKQRPEVVVRLYGPSEYLPADVFGSCLDVRCDVPDEELLFAYQTAALALLPLEASTANNALLEAMACGLPQVVTGIEGIEDYINGDCCVTCQIGDVEAHATAVIELLNSPERRAEMSISARQSALKFDWKNIRRELKAVLEHHRIAHPSGHHNRKPTFGKTGEKSGS